MPVALMHDCHVFFPRDKSEDNVYNSGSLAKQKQKQKKRSSLRAGRDRLARVIRAFFPDRSSAISRTRGDLSDPPPH